MAAVDAKVVSREPLENKDSRFIQLVKLQYDDGTGKIRDWEGTQRKTRPSTSNVDAIQIIAVLDKPTGPELLLEKQYRPPADKVVIELPAGLVDEGETAEHAAVRELMEETGYVGEILPDTAGHRPVIHNSPGSSSSCTYMMHMKIDLSRPENRDPKPQLEDGEFIEVFSVPLKDLYRELRALEVQGFAIDGKIGALAEGLELAAAWQWR